MIQKKFGGESPILVLWELLSTLLLVLLLGLHWLGVVLHVGVFSMSLKIMRICKETSFYTSVYIVYLSKTGDHSLGKLEGPLFKSY